MISYLEIPSKERHLIARASRACDPDWKALVCAQIATGLFGGPGRSLSGLSHGHFVKELQTHAEYSVLSQMALVWMLPKFTECYPEVVGGEHLASFKIYFRFISFHLSCLHLSTFSRKNALKTGASGDASGGGILRGDKGPKNMAPLTVKPGSRSSSSGSSG